MRSPFTVLGAAIGIVGAVMLVLGLVIWTGQADRLIGLHMLIGLVLVALIWVLDGLALRAGVSVAQVAPSFVMSLVMPAFGMVQESLLPDNGHVVIQLIHLAIGIGTLALAGRLSGVARRAAEGRLMASRA